MSIFERASRLKVRFVGVRGSLSTEDLWDLSFEQLDGLYAGLAEQVQKEGVKHLLDASRADDVTTLKMALVERVFTVKVDERNARATREQARVEFNRLLDIKARKQDAALEGLTTEELDAKIAALQAELS